MFEVRSILVRKTMLQFLAIYFLLLLIHSFVSIVPGDDTYFQELSTTRDFGQFISERYNGWSGRLFAESGLYFLFNGKVWLWKLLNPLMLLLLAYSIVRILLGKANLSQITLALLSFGYLSYSILSSGVFWITGSLNYLWPVALGTYSLILYSDMVFRHQVNFSRFTILSSSISGILATLGNEQMALCMICFAALSHTILFVKKMPQNKFSFVLSILFVLSSCVLFFAPGNDVRFKAEVITWFPNFNDLTIKDHIYVGLIWLFKKIFIELKGIMFLVSGIAFLASIRVKTLSYKPFRIFCILFLICITLTITNKHDIIYNFDAIQEFHISDNLFRIYNVNPSFLLAILPYLFWSLYIILICAVISKLNSRKLFIFICFIASLCSMVVMFFSPTMIASGNRVLMVGGVLLCLIIINEILTKSILENKFSRLLFSIFPLTNICMLIFVWIKDGYHIM